MIWCVAHCFTLPCPVCKDHELIEQLAQDIERLELDLVVANDRIAELQTQLAEATKSNG